MRQTVECHIHEEYNLIISSAVRTSGLVLELVPLCLTYRHKFVYVL